jgi:hypothetical protein
MSSNASYITTVGNDSSNNGVIYMSVNFGSNWQKAFNADYPKVKFTSVSVDSTGANQIVLGNDTANNGYVYVSKNYGYPNTWVQNYYIDKTLSGDFSFNDIVISPNGTNQITLSNGTTVKKISSSNPFVGNYYKYNQALNLKMTSIQLKGMSTSTSGKYQTIVGTDNSNNGYIFVSDGSGSIGSWLNTPVNFKSIYDASNDLIKYGDFKSSDNPIYIVSVNTTGQFQTAAGNYTINGTSNGYIYVSGDFGRNWHVSYLTSNSYLLSQNVSFKGLSIDNNCIFATAMDDLSNNYIFVSSNLSSATIQTLTWNLYYTSSVNLSSIKIMPNPQITKLFTIGNDITSNTGGYIYQCPNYNPMVVFMNVDRTLEYVSGISLSSTGQYQTVVGRKLGKDYILVSNNYGNSFSIDASFDVNSNPYIPGLGLQSVAMSSSGLYQTVVGYDNVNANGTLIYVSQKNVYSLDNSPNPIIKLSFNWKAPKTIPNKQVTLQSVAVSSSGEYQTTVGYDSVDNGYIYSSNDYGSNWYQTKDLSNVLISVAMSSSGQHQTAVGYNSRSDSSACIYTTNNYGSVWALVDSSTNPIKNVSHYYLNSVSISSSGQYQTIVGNNSNSVTDLTGYILVSFDYGNTWTNIFNSAYNIQSTSVSSNGQYQTICYRDATNKGYMYCCVNNLNNGNNKTFVIDHPIKKDKYLVHACLEGPEAGVYYRGKGEITNNHCVEITLPDYVSLIAYNFTVQITPIYSGKITAYNASEIEDNKFNVYGENGSFYWTVYGIRNEIIVEPNKKDVELKGSGPYLWVENK